MNMKRKIFLKTTRLIAMAIAAGCVSFGALGEAVEELDLTGNWVLNGSILTNTVTDWAFTTSGGAGGLSITGIANEATNKTTVIDFSMLTNATTSACRITSVGGFKDNKLTISLYMPSTVTSIGSWVFANCSASLYFDFSTITFVSARAFNGATLPGEIYAPVLTEIGTDSFNGAKQITRIEMPKIPTVPGAAFSGIKELETAIFQSATSIGHAFDGCNALYHLVIPSATNLPSGYFIRNTAITTLKLPWCMEKFAVQVFLGKESLPKLLVHTKSPLAEWDDETINTTSKRNKTLPVVRYGGSVLVENVDWFYDDSVWNEETKTYDIQSDAVTIVAAPGATNILETVNEEVVANDVQITIPKKLNIPVVTADAEGEPGAMVTNYVYATVSAIEACAFKNNQGLTCVTVPRTVTRIGVSAFPKGCYIKVKASEHAEALVAQLNAEYGIVEGTEDQYYASVDNGRGLVIIVR